MSIPSHLSAAAHRSYTPSPVPLPAYPTPARPPLYSASAITFCSASPSAHSPNTVKPTCLRSAACARPSVSISIPDSRHAASRGTYLGRLVMLHQLLDGHGNAGHRFHLILRLVAAGGWRCWVVAQTGGVGVLGCGSVGQDPARGREEVMGEGLNTLPLRFRKFDEDVVGTERRGYLLVYDLCTTSASMGVDFGVWGPDVLPLA